jgi:hypothetical protein
MLQARSFGHPEGEMLLRKLRLHTVDGTRGGVMEVAQGVLGAAVRASYGNAVEAHSAPTR